MAPLVVAACAFVCRDSLFIQQDKWINKLPAIDDVKGGKQTKSYFFLSPKFFTSLDDCMRVKVAAEKGYISIVR